VRGATHPRARSGGHRVGGQAARAAGDEGAGANGEDARREGRRHPRSDRLRRHIGAAGPLGEVPRAAISRARDRIRTGPDGLEYFEWDGKPSRVHGAGFAGALGSMGSRRTFRRDPSDTYLRGAPFGSMDAKSASSASTRRARRGAAGVSDDRHSLGRRRSGCRAFRRLLPRLQPLDRGFLSSLGPCLIPIAHISLGEPEEAARELGAPCAPGAKGSSSRRLPGRARRGRTPSTAIASGRRPKARRADRDPSDDPSPSASGPHQRFGGEVLALRRADAPRVVPRRLLPRRACSTASAPASPTVSSGDTRG
jgi:hypothetical protein